MKNTIPSQTRQNNLYNNGFFLTHICCLVSIYSPPSSLIIYLINTTIIDTTTIMINRSIVIYAPIFLNPWKSAAPIEPSLQ